MKTLIKLSLVLCLFCSAVLAGDMPGGGYAPPAPCTENCGNAAQSGNSGTAITSSDVLLIMVEQYLRIRF